MIFLNGDNYLQQSIIENTKIVFTLEIFQLNFIL